MADLAAYNFYWTTIHAKATLAATAQSSSVKMQGLPFGIDPKLLITFLFKTSGETGSSTTMDMQVQGSHDDSTFMNMGAAETQLTEDPGSGVIYVPDFSARYYRVDMIGSFNTDFLNFEGYAVVATAGYRVST